MLDCSCLQNSVGFFIINEDLKRQREQIVDEIEPTEKAKRQVKDPETFRERALKVTADQEKPKKIHPIRRAIGKFFRSIGRALQRLFKVQPFKAIGWVFKMIGKVVFPKYLRSSFAELKLVSWPNWHLSRRLTYAVLIFAVVFGASIALVDYGLGKVFKSILLK
jgi:preprotein translocase SecE subunit